MAAASPLTAHPLPDPPPPLENRVWRRIASFPASLDDLSALLANAEGRDRCVGLVQDILLLASGGEPGALTKLGLGLLHARRPFRAHKPMECLLPLLRSSGRSRRGPKGVGVLHALGTIRAVAYAVNAGADQLVWAGHVGVLRRDTALMRWANGMCLGGWCVGAGAAAAAKAPELAAILRSLAQLAQDAKTHGVNAGVYAQRRTALEEKLTRACLDVFSGCAQALVALGLLGAIPLEKRSLSALGVCMALAGMYQVLLTLPAPANTPAGKGQKGA